MKTIKSLFAGMLLGLFASVAYSATLSPVALLNPAGSTLGQVITSTGPNSSPIWKTVTLSGLGGLAVANNLSDVASASISRTNLGLGTSAVVNTGTSGATIPLLNTANTWTLAQTFNVRPTFNGNTPYDTGNLAIANYLTTAAAASTYATIAQTTSALTATGGSINGVTIGQSTPLSGAFTTISATGLITPSTTVGIKGTATNDSAQAGSVGEYLTANTSGTSITTGTAVNATSMPLAAGDYDVSCTVQFLPAAGTVVGTYAAGINTTTATRPSYPSETLWQGTTTAGNAASQMPTPSVRISTALGLTAYCTAFSVFSTSTMTVNGTIRARRIR